VYVREWRVSMTMNNSWCVDSKMREALVFAPVMLTPTRAIIGAGLRDKVALLTNGQFCGGSHDFCIGTLLMKLALNLGKISPRRHQRLRPLQNWRPKFKISHQSLRQHLAPEFMNGVLHKLQHYKIDCEMFVCFL
jgi:hypothetical protein